MYLVISTPGIEPLDPFDAYYFDQDDMLKVKEETGANLKAVNEVFVKTPALVEFWYHNPSKYDPEEFFSNPDGLASDLTEDNEDMSVFVVISPKI